MNTGATLEPAPEERLYDIVDIRGKGKGLVAQRHLRRGTLIVAEKPLISCPANNPKAAMAAVMKSDSVALDEFLSFSGTMNTPLETMIARLRHFLPMSGGTYALFPVICRANHSCRPNAVYHWNEKQGRAVLHAFRDIPVGMEIEITYMEEDGESVGLQERLQDLFGFTCTCPSCSQPLAEQRRATERLRDYLKFCQRLQLSVVITPSMRLLDSIERYTLAMCKDGREGDIGLRCWDAFEICAKYSDCESAKQWSALYRDAFTVFKGGDSEYALEGARYARDPTQWEGWALLGKRKLRGPSEDMRKMVYEGPPHLQALVNDHAEPPSNNQMTVTKGQKKKAREKRKKTAELVNAEKAKEGRTDV